MDLDAVWDRVGSAQALVYNTGKTILLCWVPGHVGIRGNEHLDYMPKWHFILLYLQENILVICIMT